MLDLKALLNKFVSNTNTNFTGNPLKIGNFPSGRSALANCAQSERATLRGKYAYSTSVYEGYRYVNAQISGTDYIATFLAFYDSNSVWIYVSCRLDHTYTASTVNAHEYPAYQGGYSCRMIHRIAVPTAIASLFSSWTTYEPTIIVTEHYATVAGTVMPIAFVQSGSTYYIQWINHLNKRPTSSGNVQMVIIVQKS